MNTEKILKYISLAAASRSVAFGTDQVLRRVRQGGSICVLLSSDASARTVKQISDKCAYYSVPLVSLPTDMEALAKQCGKISPAAVICITNASLSKEIVKCAEE